MVVVCREGKRIGTRDLDALGKGRFLKETLAVAGPLKYCFNGSSAFGSVCVLTTIRTVSARPPEKSQRRGTGPI
jgi:hypothetical protein